MIFTNFSFNRLNYKNGQIFPFLIAMVCVVLIILMITVNLGQIGLMKTDVSNAADSAALAGASVLSGTLLGLGLTSDAMCGRMIEFIVAVIIEITCFTPLIGGIMAIISAVVFLVEEWLDFIKACGEATMGWSNAKKTAIQYAFQNVGVDEPRPTFKKFLRTAHNICDDNEVGTRDGCLTARRLSTVPAQGESSIQSYYDEFSQGESPAAREFGRSGFSKFLEDSKHGHWEENTFNKILPGVSSRMRITSGYGWNDDGTNCYVEGNKGCNISDYLLRSDQRNYNDYENWVETEVFSMSTYILEPWSLLSSLVDSLNCVLEYASTELLKLPVVGWFLALGFKLGELILGLISPILKAIPSGLQFAGGDTENQTDRNLFRVTVKRHKRANDLGLWRFRYGEVKAEAVSHVRRERNIPGQEDQCNTIRPALWFAPCQDREAENGIIPTEEGCAWAKDSNWSWKGFETQWHLFEAELLTAGNPTR